MVKKKVNIIPNGPITTINPPIRVPVKNVSKSIEDIRKCLIAGARVYEVLNDKGKTIQLNLANYDIDNGSTVSAMHNRPVNAEHDINYGAASEPLGPDEKVPEDNPDEPKTDSESVFVGTDHAIPKTEEPATPTTDDGVEPMDIGEVLGGATTTVEVPQNTAPTQHLTKSQRRKMARYNTQKIAAEEPVKTKDPEDM